MTNADDLREHWLNPVDDEDEDEDEYNYDETDYYDED
jgi:hypothetical protein